MNEIDEIRDRRKEGYWWFDHEIADANRDVDFLLLEIERLQRLVDAGESLYESVLAMSNPAPQYHRDTQEILLPALAEYEITTLPDLKPVGGDE